MADIETPRWRCKEKIGNLMSRLEKHGRGEVEMTTSQIQAARLYLDKTLPSLAATTHSGDSDKPIKHEHTVKWEE